jgi:hypothetical protein
MHLFLFMVISLNSHADNEQMGTWLRSGREYRHHSSGTRNELAATTLGKM